MAEEVKAEAGKETTTPSAPPEVDVLMDNSAKDAPSDLGGLFSDESKLSEANLQGHEEESATPSQEKDKTAPPEPTDEAKKAEEAKKEEEKQKADEAAKVAEAEKAKADEAAKKAAEEPGKPPEGFVPKQALAEARGQIKALKAEIDALKVQKPQDAAPITDEDARWKDFKVLSLEQYEQMVDDDPTAAVKYDRRLREWEKYQDRKERQESEAKQQNAKLKGLIDKSMEEIDQVVPGIYDDEKGPEIRRTLAAFAMENGFENADYLAVLTNPETRVVPPGADQSYLVGPGAKGIIKLLNTLRGKLASADPVKLRDELTKEIEPKLRETITKELISKFKGTGKEAYKSLTDVPGSGDLPGSSGKAMTEAEWAKLPESEREKLLGG